VHRDASFRYYCLPPVFAETMLLLLSPLVFFSAGVVVVFVSAVHYQQKGFWGVAVQSFVHFASGDQSVDSCVLR
jgi:hypothetical protein